jgi:hypothetical protein
MVAACSVTEPLPSAPGICGQARTFAFVGEATLAALGFEQLEGDPDFTRPGRFWVTAETVPIPVPDDALRRPPERMLCVGWLDARPDVGMEAMSIPLDWVAP